MSTQGWMVPMLGGVVALAIIAVIRLVRAWPHKPILSPEEEADLADAPRPALQRGAWIGLAIGGGSLAVCFAIVTTRGAMTYWVDDDLRLMVLGIFMAGLLGALATTAVPVLRARAHAGLDERDEAILARAATVQIALIVLGVAGWVMSLTERFHDEGAIPVVYLNLMFGSVILLMVVGQSLGILIGYWTGGRRGDA